MRFQIIGKNIKVTQGMQDYIIMRLAKLDTFLEEETPVRVIARVVKDDQIIEVTIYDKKLFRAEERSKDFYSAVDLVQEKLVRILRKNKEKNIEKHRKPAPEPTVNEEESIVKTKEIYIKPLSRECAIDEMESTDHDFYFYKNIDTGKIETIYKRKDGKYGVLILDEDNDEFLFAGILSA